MSRNQLNPIARIAFGLVGLVISIVLLATFFGFIPDRNAEEIARREDLCESVAMSFSSLANQIDLPAMNRHFQAVKDRNDDVRSIGVRRADGQPILEIGDHFRRWTLKGGERSTADQISIPIFGHDAQWGTIEFRFATIAGSGWWGLLQRTEIALSLFVAVFGFISFYVYLRFVLKQLSPTRVIPHRVRNALDTLAEGLVIIDRAGTDCARQSRLSSCDRSIVGGHAGKAN